jgi:hypothetical protein
MLARFALHARSTCALITTLLAASAARAEVDVDSKGELGAESRLFYPDDTKDTDIGNVAVTGRMQVDAELSDPGPLDEISARGRLFSRLDPYDDQRSRVVPEELYLNLELGMARLRAGYQMINWSATEAFHPADVINSRILDGSFENPEKVGELIGSLRFEIPDGNIEVFFMPLFAEPVLPSTRSPLSLSPPGIQLGEALVLERDGDVTDDAFQPQWGTQITQTIGDADIAVHAIQHIDRSQPLVVLDAATFTPRPVYQALTQVGLTYQHALDTTMLKLEGAYRVFDRPGTGVTQYGPVPRRNHALIAVGIEQSVSLGAGSETALLLEGQALIPTQKSYPDQLEPLFQHDVLIGARHAFNDEQSTAVLATVIVDVEHPDQIVAGASLERRLGEEWGMRTGLRLFSVPPEDEDNPVLFERLDGQHQIYFDLKRYF